MGDDPVKELPDLRPDSDDIRPKHYPLLQSEVPAWFYVVAAALLVGAVLLGLNCTR